MGSGPLLAVPPSWVHGGDSVPPSGCRDNGVVGVSHEARVGRVDSFLVAGRCESGFGGSVVLRHKDEMDDITDSRINLAGCVDQSSSTTDDDLY